jgi:hypothetical protein
MRILSTLVAASSLFISSIPVTSPSAPLPGSAWGLRLSPTDQETRLSVSDLYNHPFEVDMPSEQKIRLELRSGSYRIAGSSNSKIALHVSGKDAEKAKDFTLNFKHFGSRADLSVHGGSTNSGDVQMTIEVPKLSDLYVRVPFGELSIEGISGDKDVELHAGDLSIEVGNAADYAHVDASVNAGDLSAGPFGESRDGLFRSFQKSGTGRFKLHVHLGAGDINLR